MASTIKRKRGPEPLAKTLKRTRRLTVFFNQTEHERLVAEAQIADIKPSDLVRAKFLNGPAPAAALFVPELNLEAWRKLAAAAGNLNQIARHLNWGEEFDIPATIKALTEFRIALLEAQPIQNVVTA